MVGGHIKIYSWQSGGGRWGGVEGLDSAMGEKEADGWGQCMFWFRWPGEQ